MDERERLAGTFERIRSLVSRGEVMISNHGYDEMMADGLLAREILAGVHEARVLEDYPDYRKGPCVLLLQQDGTGQPVHAVWGIPRGKSSPAVLVTAYRPDPERWSPNFERRKK